MEPRPLISSEFKACHEKFKDLCSQPTLKDIEVPIALWANQLGRLRIWAANIAAHQTTQASLDHRLRDASHIRLQIINLLRSITRQIDVAQEILEEKEDGSLERVDEADGGDSQASEDSTEVQECFDTLVNAIDCLYQASMIVRAPARHDRLIDVEQSERDAYRPFDEGHVSDKFPKADAAIRWRLASAVTQRRRDLDHRKRHQHKLRRGLTFNDTGTEERSSMAPSETLATELRKPNLSLEDAVSVAGFSETSLAESLIQGESTRVPAVPENWTPNEGFECPYCNLPNVVLRDRAAWTKHVLKDLYPYLCLYPECSTPNLMYDSRHTWFTHMLQSHINPPGEPIRGVFVQKLPMSMRCPLCREEVAGHVAEKHMARHLQELAFWALPIEDLEDVEDEQEESASDSIANPAGNLQFTEDPVGVSKDDSNVYSPYEVDYKTERQMFVNDVPTRRDAPVATFLKEGLLHDRSRSRSQSSSGAESTEAVDEEPWPRPGKTRMPRAKVSHRALFELGYPYGEEDDLVIVLKALNREQIDEIFALSSAYLASDAASRQEVPAHLRELATLAEQGSAATSSASIYTSNEPTLKGLTPEQLEGLQRNLQDIPSRQMVTQESRELWTLGEDRTLRQLVETLGTNNWVQISEQMPNRSPKQCQDRYQQHLNFSDYNELINIPQATIPESPQFFITESHSSEEEADAEAEPSVRRGRGSGRRVRPSKGDAILISHLDPDRPDIAQWASERALGPASPPSSIDAEERDEIERTVAELGKQSNTNKAAQEKQHTAPAEEEYSYTGPREQFVRDYPSSQETPTSQGIKKQTGPSARTSDAGEGSTNPPLPKGILKPPHQPFPEDPNPVREGVAPLNDDADRGIPPGARWTKIDRKLVNPEALGAAQERFEERDDYIIVLRVLTREEIQKLAEKTRDIREARARSETEAQEEPGRSGEGEYQNRMWNDLSAAQERHQELKHARDEWERLRDDVDNISSSEAPEAEKRRGEAAQPRRCHSCNRTETSEWRRGPDGPRTLCNDCGLHYAELTGKDSDQPIPLPPPPAPLNIPPSRARRQLAARLALHKQQATDAERITQEGTTQSEQSEQSNAISMNNKESDSNHRGRAEKRTGTEKGRQSAENPDRAEREREESEERRKKEEDKVFQERVKQKFVEAGYSEAHVDSILSEKRKEHENIDKSRHDISPDLTRPTWIKVNRKYLHPDTLEAYNLPWEVDEASTPQFSPLSSQYENALTNKSFPLFLQKDTDYIIIKRYIGQSLQDELFEHTRNLKTMKSVCRRCHRRKIRCGGWDPASGKCANCILSGQECIPNSTPSGTETLKIAPLGPPAAYDLRGQGETDEGQAGRSSSARTHNAYDQPSPPPLEIVRTSTRSRSPLRSSSRRHVPLEPEVTASKASASPPTPKDSGTTPTLWNRIRQTAQNYWEGPKEESPAPTGDKKAPSETLPKRSSPIQETQLEHPNLKAGSSSPPLQTQTGERHKRIVVHNYAGKAPAQERPETGDRWK